ncbi:class I SAM-dependent methyltransferase [Falsiroseomonas sp.]|uniref:class I SAM-dependent methyltransferase n=1 Tax=Falsiroseomonas sp. TaxID=2870721 RepID=UPI003F7145DB
MSTPAAWSRGYPVAEPYPPAWHGFQSPAHLRATLAMMGVAWEVGPETPLRIAEIGCGSGYSANVLAAGCPAAEVIGFDYNPAHIAEARSFAAEAGLSNVRFEETDLAELDGPALEALPAFDLVLVHGLWSWVDDRVRDGVLRLLRRRLQPGGVVLMTYNAMPGAATGLALWRLVRSMLANAPPGSAPLGSDAFGAARAQVERLVAAEARNLLPSVWRSMLMGEMGDARPGYLLHEFATEHWRPAFFADVAAAMGSARCEYAGSATLSENFPSMTLSGGQQALWREAPDQAARELITDLCVPRAFRRDVYVRGIRRVGAEAASDAITLLPTSLRQGEVKLVAQAGEAALPPHIIGPMREALLQGPQTIAALRALPGCGGATPQETLAMLVGSHVAMPMWQHPGAVTADSVAAARRMNAASMRRLAPHGVSPLAGEGSRLALATPVLGGGLFADPLEVAVATLMAQHPPGPDGAVDVPALMDRLVPPGPTPPPEALAGVQEAVLGVLRQRWPLWRAMGIA